MAENPTFGFFFASLDFFRDLGGVLGGRPPHNLRVVLVDRVDQSHAPASAPLFLLQVRPEGRNRRGETRLRGPEVLGPLRASEFDPSFQ